MDFGMNSGTGQLTSLWDDRTGSSYAYNNAAGVVLPNVWQQVALQKAAGAHTVRVFIDGVQRLAFTPGAPISNIDSVRLVKYGSSGVLVREFNVRSKAAYSSSGFASTMGNNKMLRWNSMML
jgi:hypothetical protein